MATNTTNGRLTFRHAVADTAWQKQLRDRHNHEGVPPVPHLDVKRAQVRAVSRAMAEQIILKYEWLGTMSATGTHYGLFFGPFCAGVTCVSVGSGTGGTNTHKPFGIDRHALGVLARGACVHWAPTGANSKLVSWTTRLLARDHPGLKVLLAYADSDAGEIGTIYQACGWTYTGRTSTTRQWVAPNGRIYDQKLPSNLAHQHGTLRRDHVSAMRAAGWREQETNRKHRYVQIIDKQDRALRERIEAMKLPYPKRDSERPESIDSDAATVQVAEGGAHPTSGLHALPPDPLEAL